MTLILIKVYWLVRVPNSRGRGVIHTDPSTLRADTTCQPTKLCFSRSEAPRTRRMSASTTTRFWRG